MRYMLLKNWMYKALADHPEIIKESFSSIDVYQKLNDLWLEDVQKAMKELAIEMMATVDEGPTQTPG